MSDSSMTRSMTWRLVQVMEALVDARNGLGVRETSRRTGIDKSAVGRLLTQLQELDMATQDTATGRYYVGSRLFAIGAAIVARDSLGRAAHPILERLAGRFNETCYLAVRESDGFAFRAKVESTRPIRYIIDLGLLAPFHAGAAGRAILMGLPDDELQTTLAALEPERFTATTITDREVLRRTVDRDRQRGYAFSAGERVQGGTALAAPYFDATGTCRGAVVFTRPAQRHSDDDLDDIGKMVIAAARDLSERLGHKPGPPAEG
ncbi:MAG TPA: IclR family transcriptional regulator [Euzebyales bacterium]|nr:IclR family transcriptional regulator [Euzebyales bacterium]